MKFFQKINQKMLLLLLTSIAFTNHNAIAMVAQQANPMAYAPQMQQAMNPQIAALQAIRSEQDIGQRITSLQNFMNQNSRQVADPATQTLFATILVEVFNDGRVAQSYMVQALNGAMQTTLLSNSAKQALPGMLQALNAQVPATQQSIAPVQQSTGIGQSAAPTAAPMKINAANNTQDAAIVDSTQPTEKHAKNKHKKKHKKNKKNKHKNISITPAAKTSAALSQPEKQTETQVKHNKNKKKHKKHKNKQQHNAIQQVAAPQIVAPQETSQTHPTNAKKKKKKNNQPIQLTQQPQTQKQQVLKQPIAQPILVKQNQPAPRVVNTSRELSENPRDDSGDSK